MGALIRENQIIQMEIELFTSNVFWDCFFFLVYVLLKVTTANLIFYPASFSDLTKKNLISKIREIALFVADPYFPGSAVSFDQRLGVAHSKCWSKYALITFFAWKRKKETKLCPLPVCFLLLITQSKI